MKSSPLVLEKCLARDLKNYLEICIGGWSSVFQPYIESATALFDDEPQEFPVFVGLHK